MGDRGGAAQHSPELLILKTSLPLCLRNLEFALYSGGPSGRSSGAGKISWPSAMRGEPLLEKRAPRCHAAKLAGSAQSLCSVEPSS